MDELSCLGVTLPCGQPRPAPSQTRFRLPAVKTKVEPVFLLPLQGFRETMSAMLGLPHASPETGPGFLSVIVILKACLLTISQELG